MTVQQNGHNNERLHIRDIAREYRKQGYEVLIEPTPNQLPEFLVPFSIDMLARNHEENVVIEVRSRGSLTSAPELDAIAQVLQDRPSWRFELVVRNPRDREASYFQDATSIDRSHIASRLREAHDLSDQEHGEAALLLAWSAVEALLRHIAAVESVPMTLHNPSQVTKSLFTYGMLDKEQYQTLQDGLETRDMVIHGFRERRSLVDIVNGLLLLAEQLQGQYEYS